VGLDAAVAVGVGVSVGAIYGVAVEAVAGVDESAAGAAGLVQASTAAAAATRATITPAMATDIGFSLDAILGCLCRGFMTGKCYTTREQGGRGITPWRRHRCARVIWLTLTKRPVNVDRSLGQ